ncbi:MAG: hypothetical protein Q8880_11150, partial [Bacteroidota bacterium]|nr:hypothetical protein [Bacteroidota bacterium]
KIQYQKENFHESLKDYQDALDMCLNIKILNCDKNKAEAGIRNSMLGIYNSFLFISRKAISKNVPELAFNYGSIALKYQKDNYKYVKFDGQPQDILYLVVNNYIAKINYDLQKKMFSAANYFLTQIKNVCDTLKEDNCYQIHKKLNSKIKSAMNIKETKTPDTSLKNQPVLITKEQTSTANQCKEVRKSVDELYRKGNFYALEDNYQYALSSYDEALNIALQNITCIMDLSQLRRNRDSIIKPATYLNNLAEIQNMITSKDYDTAFYKYLDLEKYYKNNNLKKYGFNHNPILNFILYQKDESFILTSVKNFIKIKRYQDAISTLDRLRQYKFDNKLTKEQQTLIANAIAATDYLQNPRTLPDQNIKIYISDENWFKVFVKSYKKKWEQLKK